MNPMREMRVEKVVLNMGIGEGGDKLKTAQGVLKELAGQKSVRTYGKKTIPEFGVRGGKSLGCKVTLRGERAEEILKRLFEAVEGRVNKAAFDGEGTFSFGIKEHIDIPGMVYDPKVGIFGMDVCVSLSRPGNRIKLRRRQPHTIPRSHRVSSDEAMEFVGQKFGVQVVTE